MDGQTDREGENDNKKKALNSDFTCYCVIRLN